MCFFDLPRKNIKEFVIFVFLNKMELILEKYILYSLPKY